MVNNFALEGLTFIDIDTIASEFERVNSSCSITPEFEFDADEHSSLIRFEHFYRQLSLILSKRPVTNPVLATSFSETTPPLQTTIPSTNSNTPPSGTINPVNPQYSSGSTSSTSSRESKHEHFTHTCANDFVSGSLESLKKPIERLAWYHSANCRLRHVYHTRKMHYL